MTNQNFRVKNGLEVGNNIKIDSVSGIITATKFVGGTYVSNSPIVFFVENTSQSVTNVSTVIPTFPTVTINQGNCWNSSNDTFTPTVSGVYIITAQATWDNVSISPLMYITKNGSIEWTSTWFGQNTYRKTNGSALIYMNGTTDYLGMSIY